MNPYNVSHIAVTLLQLCLDTQTFFLSQKRIPTSCHGHKGGLIPQPIRDWQRSNHGEEYDWPRKIKTVFDTFNQAYAKFYNPWEHLAANKLIVKFKDRVIFRHYISKKKGNFLTSEFIKYVTNQVIHMTWECTWYRLMLRLWRHDCNTRVAPCFVDYHTNTNLCK
jgi:hypothetical protein